MSGTDLFTFDYLERASHRGAFGDGRIWVRSFTANPNYPLGFVANEATEAALDAALLDVSSMSQRFLGDGLTAANMPK